jgi:hypothetical protein
MRYFWLVLGGLGALIAFVEAVAAQSRCYDVNGRVVCCQRIGPNSINCF